jgi:glycosyltransferase involved in cell wall biosynthesis
MALAATTRDALRKRQAEANLSSQVFDFTREGSLATFWRQATPGTTYWRGYVPMMALPGQVFPIEEDTLSMDGDQLVLKNQEGACIWQFLGDDGRTRIALKMQRQGVRTLLEVDDLYLRSAPPLYGKLSAWSRTHQEAVTNGTGYSVEMHRKVVPLVDGVIVSTEYLADRYAGYNPNVFVCPNSVLPEDWEDFERVESDTLRIGYYGSPAHARDWPRVKRVMKWAQRQKDVEVVMVGFAPPGWTGKVLPWRDNIYEARKHLAQLDVGIAPLTQNEWSNGKSDLKAVEYAMAGVLPVMEHATPYDPWTKIGWPLQPGTPDEWDEVIRDVVKNRDMVKGLAAEAREYVLRERTIDTNIDAWREALSG